MKCYFIWDGRFGFSLHQVADELRETPFMFPRRSLSPVMIVFRKRPNLKHARSTVEKKPKPRRLSEE